MLNPKFKPTYFYGLRWSGDHDKLEWKSPSVEEAKQPSEAD